MILGACNPPFEYKSLQAEKEIGLMLSCNVIVYSENGKIIISAINPVEAIGMINNPELKFLAVQIKEKLERVIENVR